MRMKQFSVLLHCTALHCTGCSTCWNPWLIPDHGWRWWLAYRDAMSFRASHYFVSFMSEASAVAAGFGAQTVAGRTQWHFAVTQPHNIEVPRSLVEVMETGLGRRRTVL